jgi:hypothetical protein
MEGKYPYFFCIGRMKGTDCEQPYVPVDPIEAAVENAYGDVVIERSQAERSSFTTSASPTQRSPSPSRRSPIRSFRSGWMVRPSPEPALLLAAVQ